MKIAVLAGDGIGKEVTEQSVKVLHALFSDKDKPEIHFGDIGQSGIDKFNDPLPLPTIELSEHVDAILFGAVGIPGDEKIQYLMRPGASLLRLRKKLDLFSNFRPAHLFRELTDASSMRPELVENLDLMILRELTGDIYFGEPRGNIILNNGRRESFNTMRYNEDEIRRIAIVAFKTARKRSKKVCSVDKANVLETMQLWREVVTEVSMDFPDVELQHLFVDAAVMELMRKPKQFDVIVTGNIFGDILSDAAAMLTGSIGMLPSASLADGNKGLYEPVHGTAPDIAGKNIANPIASILSLAMMMDYSFNRPDLSKKIFTAVNKVLESGQRTKDIFRKGLKEVGTREMGDAIVAAL